MSDKTHDQPLTEGQQRLLDSIADKAPQINNAGALYHHINWTAKLLGQDLEELPEGDYVMAFSIKRRGASTYVDRWSLAEGAPEWSLLSYNRLCELVEQGVITNVEHDQINATSIDLTLGRYVMHESSAQGLTSVSLHTRKPLVMNPMDLDVEGPTFLVPGAFMLAQSAQKLNLPNNISAEYKLKSSMARIGLEHLNAGWCDAGWNGSVLTLELKNMTQHHAIQLRMGDRIGQIVFFEHEPAPADRSYAARGRYNGDTTVEGIKP